MFQTQLLEKSMSMLLIYELKGYHLYNRNV